MALTFSDGSTDKISIASAASIDDYSVFTCMMWVNLASIGISPLYLMGKRPAGAFGKQIWVRTAPSTELTLGNIARASGNAQAGTSTIPSTNTWTFLAFMYDEGGATAADTVKIFTGDLNTRVTEVGSYVFQTQGSGATTAETGSPLVIFNQHGTGSIAPDGSCGFFAYINKNMSVEEIAVHQFRPRVIAETGVFMYPGYNGVSTQPDWAGNGNNGTVTGATAAAHVPLAPPFGFDTAELEPQAAGTTDGVGSSAGSAVVSGTGESIAEATAASSGTGVAAGVGVSTSAATGSSAGAGAVTGVGASIHEASGSSTGVAAVAGIGAATSAASGSSAGVGAVAGVGASTAASTAAAAGAATVSGIAATPSGVGSSAGVATVTGVGASTAASTAAAAGVATTAAISGSDIGIGTTAGVATVTGVGTGVTAAAAASAGSGVATGVGLALHAGSGASAGVGSATAVTLSIFEGSAAALGAAAVAGIGRSTAAGLGQAAGLAVALSIGSDGSKPPTELAAQLDSVAVLTATLDLIPVLEATVDSPGG